MVVGDFNGDQIDDIAVLSYFFINNVNSRNLNLYRPQVKIKYGKAGGSSSGGGSSFVDGDADEKFHIRAPDSAGRARAERRGMATQRALDAPRRRAHRGH